MTEAKNQNMNGGKIHQIRDGLLVGILTSVALTGLFYLGDQVASLPFVPFDIFDWLARILPGDVITLGIDGIVSVIDVLDLGSTSKSAKIIEQIAAIFLFIGVGSLLGGVIAWLIKKGQSSLVAGGIVGTLTYIIIIVIESSLPFGRTSPFSLAWTGLLTIGWGITSGYLINSLIQYERLEDSRGRRRLLAGVTGTSLVFLITGLSLGRLLQNKSEAEDAADQLPAVVASSTSTAAVVSDAQSQSEQTPTPEIAANSERTRDDIEPAPGTRSELTSNDDFYRIDINTRPLSIKEEDWQLLVAGLFDKPRELTLQELHSFPQITQPITLSCISNRVGGDLIGTSNWTGLRLRDLLEDLGLKPEAKELMVDSADGFFESVTSDDMMDPRTLLVYAMNGETLPQEHGFPLRIYIPNRYGMKQPKWIKQITAVSDTVLGYWVTRGWSHEAKPQIVSVIDSVATGERDASGQVPIGGIAWAGDRGIQKVELQVDEDPWVETVLRNPPLSDLTWVQWRYDWSPTPGKHQFRVRALDGNGDRQIEEKSGVRPDGATGYHSVEVRI